MLFWVAIIHAAYYAVTGVWPLVHMRSFLYVTGPKRDLWLVKTVGVLVLVVGAVIASAAYGGRVTPEIVGLAVGSAAALTTVDLVYVAKGVIWRMYLLDAAAEVLLIAGWAWAILAVR